MFSIFVPTLIKGALTPSRMLRQLKIGRITVTIALTVQGLPGSRERGGVHLRRVPARHRVGGSNAGLVKRPGAESATGIVTASERRSPATISRCVVRCASQEPLADARGSVNRAATVRERC